jgi:diphosphomevalonate decarboxylase
MNKAVAEASPNIAFIKYWGKEITDNPQRCNWALNPSLSLTLSKARTRTEIVLDSETEQKSYFLEGEKAPAKDILKIETHIQRVLEAIEQTQYRGWTFKSENNFPMATGLASSASAFAALTWAVIGAALGEKEAQAFIKNNLRFVSEMSRWGSGSACRSVAGPYMLWENEAAQTRDYPLKLKDTIVIVSRKKKKVSSREGHQAALTSPLLAKRLQTLGTRLEAMEKALQNAEFSAFGQLLEEEALEMHEVARQGQDSVEYWTPETRKILEHLNKISGRDYYFTLDAGPNIHFISERNITEDLLQMLSSLSIEAEIWEDEHGSGPKYI